MAMTPTPEEAIARAKQVLDDRINAIRQAVAARQHVADVREETNRQRAELETQLARRIQDAERADIKAYHAAISSGWSTDELRKIGLPEPPKACARRRSTRKPSASRSAPPVPPSDDREAVKS